MVPGADPSPCPPMAAIALTSLALSPRVCGVSRPSRPPFRSFERSPWVVRKGGLEPPRAAPPAPKAGASTNSATFARSRPGGRCGVPFPRTAAAFAERAIIADAGTVAKAPAAAKTRPSRRCRAFATSAGCRHVRSTDGGIIRSASRNS